MDYEELIEQLRCFAVVYKISGNENTTEYRLAVKAADAIERLFSEKEEYMRGVNVPYHHGVPIMDDEMQREEQT